MAVALVIWFAWMPEDYDRAATSVKEVFKLLGFDMFIKDGFVQLKEYDNKQGQEDLFLAAVAPFVKESSYVTWKGEYGVIFRHIVRGSKLMIQNQISYWAEEKPLYIYNCELRTVQLPPILKKRKVLIIKSLCKININGFCSIIVVTFSATSSLAKKKIERVDLRKQNGLPHPDD